MLQSYNNHIMAEKIGAFHCGNNGVAADAIDNGVTLSQAGVANATLLQAEVQHVKLLREIAGAWAFLVPDTKYMLHELRSRSNDLLTSCMRPLASTSKQWRDRLVHWRVRALRARKMTNGCAS